MSDKVSEIEDSTEYKDNFECFYNKKWQGFEGFWLEHYPLYLSLYADLMGKRNKEIDLRIPKGKQRILDCGCGLGDLSYLLSEKFQQVIGIDIAETNVVKARENFKSKKIGNIYLGVGLGEMLPFKDESFDYVVLADVIEHSFNPHKTLREVYRVLKDNGFLILVTPNKRVLFFLGFCNNVIEIPLRKIFSLMRNSKKEESMKQHEIFFARAKLRRMILETDFIVEEHKNIVFYPGPEGGGLFSIFLRLIAKNNYFRERFVEPCFRGLFSIIEKVGVLNQKQLVVAQKEEAR